VWGGMGLSGVVIKALVEVVWPHSHPKPFVRQWEIAMTQPVRESVRRGRKEAEVERHGRDGGRDICM